MTKHTQTYICISILRLIFIKVETENCKASISIMVPWSGRGKQKQRTDSLLHCFKSKQAPLTVCMLQSQLKTFRSRWSEHRLRGAAWAKGSLWLWICHFRCYHNFLMKQQFKSSLWEINFKKKSVKFLRSVLGAFHASQHCWCAFNFFLCSPAAKMRGRTFTDSLKKGPERKFKIGKTNLFSNIGLLFVTSRLAVDFLKMTKA